MSQNSMNQVLFLLFLRDDRRMIEGSGSGARAGSGSKPLTNGSGSGSRRPKNMWIWWIPIRIRIQIRNTDCSMSGCVSFGPCLMSGPHTPPLQLSTDSEGENSGWIGERVLNPQLLKNKEVLSCIAFPHKVLHTCWQVKGGRGSLGDVCVNRTVVWDGL